MSFQVFIKSICKLIFLYFIILLIFIAGRIALILSFGNASDLRGYWSDLFNAFVVGFRYDTVVFTYSFLILFLLACIPLKQEWYDKFYRKFFVWYSSIALFLMLWLQIGDYYFFKFFQSHFNLLVFGIVYDDTRAVLQSVWTDYPLIRLVLGFILTFGFLIWIIRKISLFKFPNKLKCVLWQRVLISLLIILLYALGLRGSLGIFPIEKDDATISPNNFVNNLTMNGIFALKDAYADLSRSTIDTDTSNILKKYGFKSRGEALAIYTKKEIEPGLFTDALFDTTLHNQFLVENPPNVLFILMESMSNYYFDLQSENLDLLGSLKQELPFCYLFRNFTSCTNGTVHTLEGLMVNSPLTPLSQSIFMNKSLKSSVAKTFIDNRYETSFITGARLGWRNLGKYVSTQYFQDVEGSSHLLEAIPDAQSCEWGVYDEFLFERLFQKLSNAKGKPMFIFAFTTSNHTPYQLPESYIPQPVRIPDSLRERQRYDDRIAKKNFTAYQYANNCLGNLLNRIRNSSFGKNTIVVVTGDHNTVALYDFSDRQLLEKYSVPLLMYIPDEYKPAFANTARFGSHKDIFPTVINLALSDAVYVNSGNNLFEETNNDKYFAINDYKTAFNEAGAVILGRSPLFYRFDKNKRLIPTTLFETPGLEALEKAGRAHGAVLSLLIQEQLSH